MTWEYDNPSANPKDEVRFLVGDVDDTEQLLSDEEVDYLVSTYGDPTLAAVAGAKAIASRFAKASVSSKAVGDLQIAYRDRAEEYRLLAKAIASSTGGVGTVRPRPQATGITQTDLMNRDTDTERLRESFRIGMDDIPDGWPPGTADSVIGAT